MSPTSAALILDRKGQPQVLARARGFTLYMQPEGSQRRISIADAKVVPVDQIMALGPCRMSLDMRISEGGESVQAQGSLCLNDKLGELFRGTVLRKWDQENGFGIEVSGQLSPFEEDTLLHLLLDLGNCEPVGGVKFSRRNN